MGLHESGVHIIKERTSMLGYFVKCLQSILESFVHDNNELRTPTEEN